MTAPALRLHHATASTASAIVRVTLAEKGLAYESRVLDIQKGEQHRPEYRAINPRGVVPALEHEGHVICESTVIAQYLDETFPTPALMPSRPAGRAAVRLWLKRVDEKIHPASLTLTFALAFRRFLAKRPPEEIEARFAPVPDTEAAERARAAALHGLDAPQVPGALRAYDLLLAAMDDALARSPYLTGDDFSLADAAITPYIVRAEMLGLGALWIGRRPRVVDWFERVRARPSFDEAFTRVFTEVDRQRLTVPAEDSEAKRREVLGS